MSNRFQVRIPHSALFGETQVERVDVRLRIEASDYRIDHDAWLEDEQAAAEEVMTAGGECCEGEDE